MESGRERQTPLRARRAISLFAAYLSGKRFWILGLGAAVLASNGLLLANPLVLRSFIDAIGAGAGLEALYPKALLFIAVALAIQALALLSTWLGQNLGWMATNDLRLDLLRRVLSMDLAWHKEHLPGELIERVDGDTRTLMGFFSDFAMRLLGSALLMVGVLISLFAISPLVGCVMTVYAAFTSVFLLRLGMLAVPSWKAHREKGAEFFGFLGERLTGREDLKSLGATGHSVSRLQALITSWYPVRRKANILGYTMWTSSEFVAGIGMILSLGLGALLWRKGAMSLGTVYLVYSYTELIRRPLEQLREQLEDLQKALAGATRIDAFLSLEPSVKSGELEPPSAQAAPLRLEFRSVGFSYEEGRPVLSDINLEVEAGSSLGIVGRTGCGKTSLARLALRFHEASSGMVLLDGRPIGEYRNAWLRRRVAVVTQDVELFTGSVRDNVRLWDASIADSAILSAFARLGLDAWLQGLPEGLGHRIGPGGEGLSAGQAQLLAMVRVFLRDPGLVVLDEASSRLDPATESLVDSAVARLLEGRTSLIIAHRLSTLSRVDRVLVMEEGRIAELGKRTELEADSASRYFGLLRTAGMDLAKDNAEDCASRMPA